MNLIHFENRVLTLFGRVIKPANWLIFSGGVVLMILSPFLYWLVEQDLLTVGILFIQGVQLMCEGYGQIKDAEDLHDL